MFVDYFVYASQKTSFFTSLNLNKAFCFSAM